jgi:hypothetical protein
MINTTGRCDGCSGIVRNVSFKRYSLEKLTEIHNKSCAGIPTTFAPRKSKMADAADEVKAAVGA